MGTSSTNVAKRNRISRNQMLKACLQEIICSSCIDSEGLENGNHRKDGSLNSFVIPDLLRLMRVRVRCGPAFDVQNLESPFHFSLHEIGCSLVSPVVILFVDGAVMSLGILAALDHEHDQVEELRIGIVGIINMCR